MDMSRPSGRSLRGFASMNKVKQKEIASKGGRAAHEKGTAHEFTSLEAANAAKRGHERGTAHEFTPEEARVAGRKGGMARAANRKVGEQGPATGIASTPIPAAPSNPAEISPPLQVEGSEDFNAHNPT